MPALTYKIATDPNEWEQIHQLNHLTFVEEIPQHEKQESNRLVDQFHEENVYIVAKKNDEVVGMIAVRSNRPFSLDRKLEDLDDYLPADAVPCEIRLLSIKKEYRSTRVFFQLCAAVVDYCLAEQYNMAVISGTVRQLKLYRKIGFVPFGPLVGSGEALYQPMYLTKDRFETNNKAFRNLMKEKTDKRSVSFLPGPVPVHPLVEAAFTRQAISHRNKEFIAEMESVREKLRELTSANHVQILVGTGTLANDVVAAQLKRFPGKGLILANGEFGYRLIDHAKRIGLGFHAIEKDWNEPIEPEEVALFLEGTADIEWVWTVHCETSTGYLYDIENLLYICRQHGAELVLDACSSAGVVPVNLEDIYLASSVSGKGFGSYPGLAILFHREKMGRNASVPRFLDIGMYEDCLSIPFTHSSNLVRALGEALVHNRQESVVHMAAEARKKLVHAGFTLLGDEVYSPGILTIVLPDRLSSREFGDACRENGILLSYESDYLLKRNWVQLALMGYQHQRDVAHALDVLEQQLHRSWVY
ncbi:aminotransferase class V-fold PLP-dependent enzyme [Bacillus sp. REN3]|uniref:aminotransferase class V-fold PLP-dependent enzyme n=1 Tax=Bacillus sp. REN3 TaxID=2802440 RepID=UPI0032BF5485